MGAIAPCLLAWDFACLGDALGAMKNVGASMVHVDVMDGHFAPEISVGLPVVASLRKATDLVLDVHLQIEHPERFAADFVEAGANRVSIHAESTPRLHSILERVRRLGARAGIALNPATPVESVRDILDEADFLNLLLADVGWSDGNFNPRSLEKVSAARAMLGSAHGGGELEVEGSIGPRNIREMFLAGADILVVGPAICRKVNNRDAAKFLGEMVQIADKARDAVRPN